GSGDWSSDVCPSVLPIVLARECLGGEEADFAVPGMVAKGLSNSRGEASHAAGAPVEARELELGDTVVGIGRKDALHLCRLVLAIEGPGDRHSETGLGRVQIDPKRRIRIDEPDAEEARQGEATNGAEMPRQIFVSD